MFGVYLLSEGRTLVDFTSLLLALALEVVMAVAMPLLMKLYIISLRLKRSENRTRLADEE